MSKPSLLRSVAGRDEIGRSNSVKVCRISHNSWNEKKKEKGEVTDLVVGRCDARMCKQLEREEEGEGELIEEEGELLHPRNGFLLGTNSSANGGAPSVTTDDLHEENLSDGKSKGPNESYVGDTVPMLFQRNNTRHINKPTFEQYEIAQQRDDWKKMANEDSASMKIAKRERADAAKKKVAEEKCLAAAAEAAKKGAESKAKEDAFVQIVQNVTAERAAVRKEKEEKKCLDASARAAIKEAAEAANAEKKAAASEKRKNKAAVKEAAEAAYAEQRIKRNREDAAIKAVVNEAARAANAEQCIERNREDTAIATDEQNRTALRLQDE